MDYILRAPYVRVPARHSGWDMVYVHVGYHCNQLMPKGTILSVVYVGGGDDLQRPAFWCNS